MNRKELIELHHDIEEAVAERQRLGDFDANSRHMRFLMESMERLVAHAIEQKLTPKKKRGK